MRIIAFNFLLILFVLNSVHTVDTTHFEPQRNYLTNGALSEGIPYPFFLSPSNSSIFPFNLTTGEIYSILIGGEYISKNSEFVIEKGEPVKIINLQEHSFFDKLKKELL